MVNIVILASGFGSNFYSLAKEIKNNYEGKINLLFLLTNNKDANAINFANILKIKTKVVSDDKDSSEEYSDKLLKLLSDYEIRYILLAGFMKLLSPKFIKKYENRIINIHPSLLPKHKGKDALVESLKSDDEKIGSTLHYVTEELDSGKIIKQIEMYRPDLVDHEYIEYFKGEENKMYCSILPDIAAEKL